MDGTFVTELVAQTVKEPKLIRLADGRELVLLPDLSGAGAREWTIVKRPPAQTLRVATLQGLADYLRAGFDETHLPTGELLAVHVASFRQVDVVTETQEDLLGGRHVLASAVCEDSCFAFGTWHGYEEFVIGLQSSFVPTPAREDLLKLVSSIRGGDVRETTDSGVSQEVKATKGVALVANVPVRSRWTLQPYRTFREVEQPASDFVLRLASSADQKPQLLLAEADGGVWQLEAVRRVAAWLRAELAQTLPSMPPILA